MTALTAVVGLFALVGAAGRELADQTLLANMLIHSSALAAALSLGIMLVGWKIVGGTGFVAAAGLLAIGMAQVEWRQLGELAGPAVRIDLVHFNMMRSNRNGVAIASWLKAEAPDVAVLLEAEPVRPHLGSLATIFPHRLGCAGAACDLVVLSRHPFTKAILMDLPGAPGRLAASRIRKDGVTVAIVATHWSKSFFSALRREQASATRQAVRAVRSGDRTMPVVLTGDFNATPWDPALRRSAEWLRLGHPARWVPTWPRRLGPFGFPIDHVLFSREVAVETIDMIPGALGSNHRGLRLGLAIPTAAATMPTVPECPATIAERGLVQH